MFSLCEIKKISIKLRRSGDWNNQSSGRLKGGIKVKKFTNASI
jgi:hypothetical protein